MNLFTPTMIGQTGGAGEAFRLCLAAILIPLGAWGVNTSGDTFDRYQLIISRQPFGAEMPPNIGAGGGDVERGESPVASLTLTMIVEDDNGQVLIGVVDSKSGSSYMLRVGETEGGIELLAADTPNERALVKKGGIERWLSLSGNDVVSGGGPRVLAPFPSPASRMVAKRVQPAGRGLTKEEYARLRHTRPQSVSQRSVIRNQEWAKLSPAEQEKRLREYNLELIRAGGESGPALPIELTPEEDAQLVAEGILPVIDGN